MEWLETYVRNAKDCRGAAARASTPEDRDYLLGMADRWESLARQRAAYMQLDSVLTKLFEQEPPSN